MRGYGNSARWVNARARALTRAGNRCQKCGSVWHLRVHHIDGRGMSGPRAVDLANLEVLCARCHRRHHSATDRSSESAAVIIPNYRRE